ncbi:MAG: YfhO family protein [Clostridiales bacterium]|nr:YfhO family protein [Clostridiales bacterium]
MIEKAFLEKEKRGSGRARDLRPGLSFLSVMASLVVIFFMTGVAPFGSRSVLVSDLSAQYAPYLATLRSKLLAGRSLTYSFEIGMGKNFMGILAYYLSSPLNLLALMFPISRISEAILLLITLKLSFAGAFMTAYLDHRFESKSKMSILFGMIYALSSYSMSFIFNFIWLDGFALLPLLILVTDAFAKDIRAAWKLMLVLIALFLSGYYMAYMAGLFSLFYLLVILEYEHDDRPLAGSERSGKDMSHKDGRTVGLFILIAICAALICASLLLPAGLDTLRNGDNSSSATISLDPNFTLVSFLPQLFLGKLTDISTNMPFVYSSLLVFILVVLLFRNQGIRRSLKLRAAIGIGAGFLSFILPPLNTAWHLFDSPNWFLYRYSYLFIFGTVLLAYYSFLHLRTLRNQDFTFTFGSFFLLLVLAECFGRDQKISSMFFQNLLVGGLITLCLWGLTREKWIPSLSDLQKWGVGILVPIILVEIIFLAPKVTVGAIWNDTQDSAAFREEVESLRSVTSSIGENEPGRVEASGTLGPNLDSLTISSYTGTNGISAFCSMSNKKQQRFLKQLGYCTNYNYFSVEHRNVIIPADSILGIRYFVSQGDAYPAEWQRAGSDRYTLWENPYAVRIAFVADPGALEFAGYALEEALRTKDYFSFQEAWISSLTGSSAEGLYVEAGSLNWQIQNGQALSDVSEKPLLEYDVKDGLNLENIEEGSKHLNYYVRNTSSMPIVLHTDLHVEKDGPLYLSIPFLMRSAPISVYCNGELLYKEESTSYYSVIVDAGFHYAGEELRLEIRCDDDVFASFDPILAYCDLDVLADQTDILKKGISDVHITDGHVSFDADVDGSRALITTIPYEEGWTVKVDGQKVQVVPYQDAFISIPIKSGHHHVELDFTPPGLLAGEILSAVGVIASAAVLLLIQRSARKQRPS